MTMETLEERSFVEERKTYLRDFWAQRDLQWVEDRKLLAMQYKQRIPPYEMITSNEVAVLHSGAIAILAGKMPNFSLPISVQDQGERLKMDNQSGSCKVCSESSTTVGGSKDTAPGCWTTSTMPVWVLW